MQSPLLGPTRRHTVGVSETLIAERAAPWVARTLWIAVLVVGGRAIDDALAGRAAEGALTWLGLAGWTAGVAAMAVPAVRSLTAARAIVPLSVPIAVSAWLGGASTIDGALFTGLAIVASLTVGTSSFGRTFVQASAYGDEDRYLLRPPLAFAAFSALTWLACAGLTTAAVLAAATDRTVVVLACAVPALAGGAFFAPRWHRASRRWLVLVPAGLVIHDPVNLGETLMLRRQNLAALGLALTGTDAFDLTGPAPGHAIEIRTTESVTILLGSPFGERAGSAIHLTGCLVAPTRPGHVLAAAAARRLPVGSPA